MSKKMEYLNTLNEHVHAMDMKSVLIQNALLMGMELGYGV